MFISFDKANKVYLSQQTLDRLTQVLITILDAQGQNTDVTPWSGIHPLAVHDDKREIARKMIIKYLNSPTGFEDFKQNMEKFHFVDQEAKRETTNLLYDFCKLHPSFFLSKPDLTTDRPPFYTEPFPPRYILDYPYEGLPTVDNIIPLGMRFHLVSGGAYLKRKGFLKGKISTAMVSVIDINQVKSISGSLNDFVIKFDNDSGYHLFEVDSSYHGHYACVLPV